MKATQQIVADMINAMPEMARRNFDALTVRYSNDVEIDAKHPAYHFWANNKALTKAAGPLYQQLKQLRKSSRYLKDKIAKPIGERYTQANIDAMDKTFRTIDPPYRSDANTWRFIVQVVGHEGTFTKGNYRGPSADLKIPITYFKNIEQVRKNRVHKLTRDGEQFICFITRYDPVPDKTLPEASVFKTRCQNISPTGGGKGKGEGWFIEQRFDDRTIYAFNWDYKKAKQLFNKRVKAKMLELLDV